MALPRRSLVVVLGVASLVLNAPLAGASQANLEPEHEVFDRLASAVVRIHSSAGYGSGFFVRQDGLILTNAHVVGHDRLVEVLRKDGQRLRGRVVERAREHVDLALVKVDAKPEAVLPLTGYADVEHGTWIAAIGYGPEAAWDFEVGNVLRVSPENSLRPIVISAIPLHEGSSGRPLVDRLGRVVGIVTASLWETDEVNFSIRADVALQTLKPLTAECNCILVSAPKDIQIYVDGRKAGRGPWAAIPAAPHRYDVFAVVNGVLRRQRIDFPERREVDLTSAHE